jgi:hypothetical protein
VFSELLTCSLGRVLEKTLSERQNNMRITSILGAVALVGTVAVGLAGPAMATEDTPSAPGTSAAPSGNQPSGNPSPGTSTPGTEPSPDNTGDDPSNPGYYRPPVFVSPATALPGTILNISACYPDQTGTAESLLFGTVKLVQTNGFTAYGRTMVPAAAKAGTYEIGIMCADGKSAFTFITVVTEKHDNPATTETQTSQVPAGAPETGAGGAPDPEGARS